MKLNEYLKEQINKVVYTLGPILPPGVFGSSLELRYSWEFYYVWLDNLVLYNSVIEAVQSCIAIVNGKINEG